MRSAPSGSPRPAQSRQPQQGELTPTDQWKIPLRGLSGGAVPAAAVEQQGSLARHLAVRSPAGSAPCRAEVPGALLHSAGQARLGAWEKSTWDSVF